MTLLLVIGAVAMTAGCGSTTEALASRWLTARIGDLMDLDRAQKRWVRERVRGHVTEARAVVLPEVIELLVRTRAVMWRGADEAALADIQQGWVELVDRGVTGLIPDAAALLATLDDDQVAHFERSLHEVVDDAFEDLELAEEERRLASEESLIAGFEDLTGELSAAQREAVLEVARAIPDERPAIRDTLRVRIGLLADGVRTAGDAAAVEALLRELWSVRDDLVGATRSPEERRGDDLHLLLTLDRSLDREQRQRAVDEMDSRIRRLQRFTR